MTKSDAKEKLAELIRESHQAGEITLFGPFVEGPYFDFYSRKWKASTAENNKQRIRTHLVAKYRERPLASFKRDELQDFLDSKGGMSFSVVDHLRWDLKQVFDMAIAEGHIRLNPALLLFTPREAKRPDHPVMTIKDVVAVFQALGVRERAIAKLAIIGGMRPGEIFGLRWDRVAETFAKVEQRIYRGLIDTPKTHHSVREAALAAGLFRDLEAWRATSCLGPKSYVFPSERGTALSKDNVWRRNMQPRLAAVGLGWCNFQVMRRTHATLMRQLKADPKLVADQLGHSVDVSLNVYAQSPVAGRLALVNELESLLIQ
ncbi:MAG: tyrosine-type recombinase/integrase [Bryobacteraceae bacterium]